jgi:hypothetical protein
MRLAALVLLGGCAVAPEPGIDALAGCWTDEGPPVVTLRLAPAADPGLLAGDLGRVRYTFARDGSRMTMDEGSGARTYPRDVTERRQPGAPTLPKKMSFLMSRGEDTSLWYSVLVTREQLVFNTSTVTAAGTTAVNDYTFKREACD